jgi:pimeloyl-ACP methyl ester carboxylesterase
MRHLTAHLLGGPVHYVDHGGRGPVMLLIHGLGGSTLNWLDTAPGLAARNHVFAIDLVGFGVTPPAGRKADLETNLALVDAFLLEVAGEPAMLVGNSMGGLISLLEAARSPERVRGLVLVNPALPTPAGLRIDRLVLPLLAAFLLPRQSERYLRRRAARLGPERVVREVLELVDLPEEKMSRSSFEAHLQLTRDRSSMPWAERSFVEAARSLLAYLARPRLIRGVLGQVSAPALLIHGHNDRVIPMAAARAIHKVKPQWIFRDLQGVGHVPMLETPDEFVRVVEEWLDETFPDRRERAG